MSDYPTSSTESILSFINHVSGDTFLKVEETFEDGFVRLNTSEAERRQAKHDIQWVEDVIIEMLRNSRDAKATKIFVATTADRTSRSITIIDDGTGVPQQMASLIFEPRVTSKLETMVMDEWGVHGRGMALYSIKQNVDEIELMKSSIHKGSAFRVNILAETLKERADQSSAPKVKLSPEGVLAVESGPKNIQRHVVEFALAHPEVDVFYGSPSEIVATMLSLATNKRDGLKPHHTVDIDSLLIWMQLACAYNAADLADMATDLGLAVSERTAHRILRGDIAPLKSIVASCRSSAPQGDSSPDIYKDVRGLRIADDDLIEFRNEIEQAFDDLASKYYLSPSDELKVRVAKGALHITIPFEKEL